MKVAIVHDYLVNKGGAERVVLALHRHWPDAQIYTSIYHADETFDEFRGARIRTSALQRLSRSSEDFRRSLPLFGPAFARMRIDADVVVSSSSGFAHHVRPRAPHLSYVYSPPRFLWDDRYDHAAVTPTPARPFLPPLLALLRRADLRAMARVDRLLAVGERTRRAIDRVYGRASEVLYPPVEVDRFEPSHPPGDGALLLGRLMPHRNQEIAVRAFTQMGRPLMVVGEGPWRPTLESLAGPTITFAGGVSDQEVVQAYRDARYLVVPGEEDFGLVAVEANAAGRAVVALGKGGALETVRDGETGVLFDDETPDALADAVARADAITFDPARLRANAERFAPDRFIEGIDRAVAEVTR